MCGITGFARKNGGVFSSLQKMAESIQHRGPDHSGYLLASAEASDALGPQEHYTSQSLKSDQFTVGLAHLRLSIVDISARAHQPMTRENGHVWMVYNGEVYNYLDLKKDLQAIGYTFKSGSDSEVIIAAYQHWGPRFVERCQGMFAIVILDADEEKLFFYRDRLGIKPLFLRETRNGVDFSSEIKSLMLEEGSSAVLNAQSVGAYFRYQMVQHTPDSFFVGVRELPAGHMMTLCLKTGETRQEQYYDLAEAVEKRRADVPEDEAEQIEYIRSVFNDTVHSHLMGDVRVGACLSGGVDSSSIVCTANQLMNQSSGPNLSDSLGGEIVTFSSCHQDRRFDEQEYIDLVNNRCSTKPVKIFTQPDDLAEDIDTLIWHQDEPFTSPSIYAQYRLMKAARDNGVTVLLDGQGGDEIFAGYRKFFFFMLKGHLKNGGIGPFLSECMGGLRNGDGDLFDFRAMKRFLPFAAKSRSVDSMLDIEKWPQLKSPLEGFTGAPTLWQRQVLDLLKFSAPSLLRYEDRNSMAFGIEARVPFLDHIMVESAVALPTKAKIKNGVAKFGLREAMRGCVPDEILDRRTKMGFVTPELAWMQGALRPVMEEMHSKPHYLLKEIMDVDAVQVDFQSLLNGEKSRLNAREHFRVFCLDRWLMKFNVTDIG